MSNGQNLILVEADDFYKRVREMIRAELKEFGDKKAEKEVSYTVNGLTEKPYYKAHEVCEMLQISRQTLHAWVKEGILKKHKIRSRVYFLAADIKAMIDRK